MVYFRLLLLTLLVWVVLYTIPVVMTHGLNLFPHFFGAMKDMTWSGQFNTDFMGFLILSGLWMAWRNQFSLAGSMLGILGFFGGIPVLTVYLLYLSSACQGDMARIMLGDERAGERSSA